MIDRRGEVYLVYGKYTREMCFVDVVIESGIHVSYRRSNKNKTDIWHDVVRFVFETNGTWSIEREAEMESFYSELGDQDFEVIRSA